MLIRILLALCVGFGSQIAAAASFSADAVQMRGSEISHARMYWADGRVRFEYLDQGVPMVQIFDTLNKKVIWLDTEKQVYLQQNLPDDSPLLTAHAVGTKGTQGRADPCVYFENAECTRLKTVEINGRKTAKWLITLNEGERDYHVFQWLDSEHAIPVRQENPDGSILDVHILDDQEYDGRVVRKVDMLAITPEGKSVRGIQWYDEELDVVVRQQSENGAIDELRNIRVEEVGESMFTIPDGYRSVETRLKDAQPRSALTFETVTKQEDTHVHGNRQP